MHEYERPERQRNIRIWDGADFLLDSDRRALVWSRINNFSRNCKLFHFDGRMRCTSVNENASWIKAPILGQNSFLDLTRNWDHRSAFGQKATLSSRNRRNLVALSSSSQTSSHHNTAWQALHFVDCWLLESPTFTRSSRRLSLSRLLPYRHLRDKTTCGQGRHCWNRATDDEADSTAIFCYWDSDIGYAKQEDVSLPLA